MAQQTQEDKDIARLHELVDAEKARIGALIRDCKNQQEQANLRLQYALLIDNLDSPDDDFIEWIYRQDPDLAQRIWGTSSVPGGSSDAKSDDDS